MHPYVTTSDNGDRSENWRLIADESNKHDNEALMLCENTTAKEGRGNDCPRFLASMTGSEDS
jgi:hypothetical protein